MWYNHPVIVALGYVLFAPLHIVAAVYAWVTSDRASKSYALRLRYFARTGMMPRWSDKITASMLGY